MNVHILEVPENYNRDPGADLEIFDRGGPIEYPMGIYQNSGPTKIVEFAVEDLSSAQLQPRFLHLQ